MRIYLRFYDKDIMLNKIALENAIQSDVEQCLKNKMMKQFSYDDIKNNSIRHCALIKSAYAFDGFINKKGKLNAKNIKIQEMLVNATSKISNI